VITACDGWLPPGKVAAVCLSLDDVHPGRSTGDYEAGGDLAAGVLGRLERLLELHQPLRATLFVTPAWRERSPVPTRRRLARLPVGRNVLHLAPRLGRKVMRLGRHPEFGAYLRGRPCFELAVHGLYHVARGARPTDEFAGLGVARARRRLRRARWLFERAGLSVEPGFCPPGWALPPALARALAAEGFRWVSAARDLDTPVDPSARTGVSGLPGALLLAPEWLGARQLVHFPVNFQATSSDARAEGILAAGGLLSVKAHAVKDALGHIALDGLDEAYCARLDRLFGRLRGRYGDALWWTTMGEISARVWNARTTVPA
jgi:peptidoglycan/xylan/chitin deacetylase (PgdA/CDA1 family)